MDHHIVATHLDGRHVAGGLRLIALLLDAADGLRLAGGLRLAIHLLDPLLACLTNVNTHSPHALSVPCKRDTATHTFSTALPNRTLKRQQTMNRNRLTCNGHGRTTALVSTAPAATSPLHFSTLTATSATSSPNVRAPCRAMVRGLVS